MKFLATALVLTATGALAATVPPREERLATVDAAGCASGGFIGALQLHR